MKKFLGLLLGLLLSPSPVYAQFCPIDRTPLSSQNEPTIRCYDSIYEDSELLRADLSYRHCYYNSLFISCPVCHYSGQAQDFGRGVSPVVKNYVLEQLEPFLSGQKLDSVSAAEISLQLAILEQRPPYHIAWLALYGSYMLHPDTTIVFSDYPAAFPKTNRRRLFQAMALHYFELAWDEKTVTQEKQLTTAYLMGELSRRLGKFANAIQWFEHADKLSKQIPQNSQIISMPELKALLRSQHRLAVQKNADDRL